MGNLRKSKTRSREFTLPSGAKGKAWHETTTTGQGRGKNPTVKKHFSAIVTPKGAKKGTDEHLTRDHVTQDGKSVAFRDVSIKEHGRKWKYPKSSVVHNEFRTIKEREAVKTSAPAKAVAKKTKPTTRTINAYAESAHNSKEVWNDTRNMANYEAKTGKSSQFDHVKLNAAQRKKQAKVAATVSPPKSELPAFTRGGSRSKPVGRVSAAHEGSNFMKSVPMPRTNTAPKPKAKKKPVAKNQGVSSIPPNKSSKK